MSRRSQEHSPQTAGLLIVLTIIVVVIALTSYSQEQLPTTQTTAVARASELALAAGLPSPQVGIFQITAAPSRGIPATATPSPSATLYVPSATPTPSSTITPPPSATGGSRPPSEAVAGATWVSPIDGMTLVFVPAGTFRMGIPSTPTETHEPPPPTPEPGVTLPTPTPWPTDTATPRISPTPTSTYTATPGPSPTPYLGSNFDEQPVHEVYLDAYWIDRTEVTNAMFARFVAQTGFQTQAERTGWSRVYFPENDKFEKIAGADWRHPEGPESSITGLDNYPVVNVSWHDAWAYCLWANRRLPTEAEWEKAARGTDERLFPWGNALPDGTRLNYADRRFSDKFGDQSQDDGYARAAPVGSYPAGASPYGALDMAGNVWEWTMDWHMDDYYAHSPHDNPIQEIETLARVVRGGSWSTPANVVRVVNRNWDAQESARSILGFRCVLPVTKP